MSTIEVNGVHFHYELFGEGECCILFIAGYTCDIGFWRQLAQSASRDFRVLIFDHQAIGQTHDHGQALCIEDMAENIQALSSALGMSSAIVVGYAMGACLALQLARCYPDRVKKLILLSAVLQWSDAAKSVIDELLRLREQGEHDRMMERLYTVCVGATAKKMMTQNQFRGFIEGSGSLQSLQDQRRQARALTAFDATEWAGQLKTTATVFAPLEDSLVTLAQSHQLASALQARCIDISCGHCGLLELPALEEMMLAEIRRAQ